MYNNSMKQSVINKKQLALLLSKECNWTQKQSLLFIEDCFQWIKDSLKKRTSEAYEMGIFGAPTFVSNNKIFWGQDRLEFVIREASK